MKSLSSILLLTAFNFTSFGQTSKPVPAHQDTIPGQPVTTSHQIQTGKETLIYKTVTGYMPVKDKEERLN